MNYKAYIYIITLFLSIFTLSCVNFDKIFRANKVIESHVLVIILSITLSYLTTNFITDFINVSSLIKG